MASQEITFGHELLRKGIHLSSLWMCALIMWGPWSFVLAFFTLLLVGMVTVELGRREVPWIQTQMNRWFSPILREHETKDQFTGGTYMLLAVVVSLLLFHQSIAALAFGILIVGDTFAALVGRRWGRIHILGKTLEGFLAFVLASAILALFFSTLDPRLVFWPVGLVGATVGGLVELVSGRLGFDDNITICLSAGCAMAALTA